MTPPTPFDATGVIGLLDVLGWRGVWARRPDPLGDMESLLAAIRSAADDAAAGVAFSDGLPAKLSTLSISDTIVLHLPCPDESAATALGIVGSVCQRAVWASLYMGIPLRGAVTYGDYRVNESQHTFIGPAVDEAAAWYEQGDWIGVLMAPSALFGFTRNILPPWVAYQPPLKEGRRWDTYCVDWSSQQPEVDVSVYFRLLAPLVPSVLAKFTNTLAFVKHCRKGGPDRA